MQSIGANRRARVAGEEQLPTRTNYFIGQDATQWRRDVPNYARVNVEQVYRGIDVVYYGSGKQVEYDFKVAPGADFKVIRVRFAGARRVRLDETGDLRIETPAGTLRHRKPTAYQEVNGARKEIPARYVVSPRRDVGFIIEHHDKHLPLVIDPVLSYATYFGSVSGGEFVNATAFDAAGNAYIVGSTNAPDLPTTPGALQPVSGSAGAYGDVFVAKLNPAGTAVLYATYLGGSNEDSGGSIAVDANGNATGSKLAYSTFLNAGGVKSIAVDAAGNVYATASATASDMVTTPGAMQPVSAGGIDAFVTKLNETGSAVVYSTFIGGNGTDAGYSIAADSLGNSYVTGATTSTDFPLVNPLQSRKRGGPLFKPIDGGSNWDAIPASPDTPTSLIVDPQTPSTLYALAPRDLLKSTNGGATWRVIAPRVTDSLVIDPVRPTILHGFSGRSIYKSTDAGVNWQRSDFSANIAGYFSTLVIDPKMPDTLYLRAHQPPAPNDSSVQAFDVPTGVIFKSTDGGLSWTTLDFGLQVSSVACLAIDPQITSTVYAGTETHGLLKSTDGGTSWFRASGIFISRLVVDPTNSAIPYGIVFNSVWKCTNGGASWIQTRLQQSVITSLAIDPQRRRRFMLGISADYIRQLMGALLGISKRGGKQNRGGQTVTIRVRNADGQLSDEFAFTRSPD